MIELLNPLYLIGLFAAGIPLLVHLSRSKKTKKMRFSTTRFFTDQFLRSYRMSRLKELLLLVCRMALFALFAFALTQPLFRSKSASAGGSRGARTVVIVLDNSASMGYSEDGVTLLERARKAAGEVIDGLKQGDAASVVLAGRRQNGSEVLFDEPTTNFSDVRQAVLGLPVSALGTDLTAAVARAETIAQSARTPGKEVYVFSDLQDAGWEIRDDKKGSSDRPVSFFIARVRPRGPVKNVGVTAVQLGAARPMVGVPFTVKPLLSITDADTETVTVRLFVDGAKAGEQKVERLAGGRWATPRFHHTFTSGGWHSGYVEVDDPVMPLDNRRHFAVEVLDKVSLLAVNGAPSEVPRLDELFFLKLALTVSPEGQQSPIKVDTVGPGELAGADLTKYPLVILANVEQMSDAAVEKLEDFADGGGSVLVFLGDKVRPAFYNDVLAGGNRRNGGLLPGRLVEREGDPAGAKEVAFISQVRFANPALSYFEDQRGVTLTGRAVGFKALWRMDVPASSLLMKASSGAPLLAEKAFGRGRVMIFASTCDRDWTSFPIRSVFLPWVHRLVAYLVQEPASLQVFHQTGAAVRLPVGSLKDSGPLLIKKPDGTTGYGSYEEGESPALVYSDTTQPGIYRLHSTDQKELAGLFAVNLESYESNLTYLDDVLAERGDKELPRVKRVEAELKLLLDRKLVTYIEEPEQVSEAASLARGGRKLWDWVLLAVLAIGLFEPWLANRISSRHYGRPATAPVLAGSREAARGAVEVHS